MEADSPLLFQPELLKKDARELSRRHEISGKKREIHPVKPILLQDKEILTSAYRILAQSAKENRDISPAAEWLIDNFYIIQEQIVQIETDFPIGFQRNIPHLRSGVNKGLPRVYDLVHNLTIHTDNIISLENLTLYTQHYQEEVTLRLGELWAIPIMVRLVLVNQLARKATSILKHRELKEKVHDLVVNLQSAETGEPGLLLRSIIDWLNAEENGFENRLLLIELAHQLQLEGMMSEELKRWFEYRLSSFGTTLEEGLREDLQRQSKIQVSIQNAVISFRNSTEIEWEDFVEDCSIVDRILKLDPMGIYTLMDHKTKDDYRRVVERLSGRSAFTETEVAEKVLKLAEINRGDAGMETDRKLFDPSVLKTHVGYFLIGKGYIKLNKELKTHRSAGELVRSSFEKQSFLYILFILATSILLLFVLWHLTGLADNRFYIKLTVMLVALFPSLELAISIVNRFFAFTLPPRVLPKMRIKEDIPDQDRTLVVVPVILNNEKDAERYLEKLEITAHANPDPGLQFALLSDFADAERKIMLSDGPVLQKVEKGVNQLNEQYSGKYGDKFFVLHRKREWNEKERKWMGWERKRGKLEQLNHLLCNPKEHAPFSYIYGNFFESIAHSPIRFVLTLDADTRTPPGSIKELVKIASHPLNRAVLDTEKNMITEGYGIIQPRISIAPDSAYRTSFTRYFSGNVGIDIYTTAVSDVYQDLFGYGVFTGKGIYDVCAFDTVMHNRLPENRVLSHDLLESSYIRTALSTDTELFDDYPGNYNSYCKRNHRWVRGDWQIASWLLPKVPERKQSTANPIGLLSRWKIFDNLRRSLNPLFLMILFITGWFWLPGSAFLWTLVAFGILAFPIYVSFSTDILNRPTRTKWKLYVEKVRLNLKVNTIQAISTLAILPHQMILNLDAIFRALWRVNVSEKKLLEWISASQTEQMALNTLLSYTRSMTTSMVLGLSVLILAFLINPQDLWVIAPFSLLWMSSPVFAWYLSQPQKDRSPGLSEDARMELRSSARRTWFYFERLVTEEYSWLPPDNDQKDPDLPPVARTSPTNIGLTLVSTVSAFEMGYITARQLFSRLERTLASLARLERYKGHFFNWYDIRLGEVLNPKYISTVDSGNLAAGLMVVEQAVEHIWHRKSVNDAFWDGLLDTVHTVNAVVEEYRLEFEEQPEVYQTIGICIQNMLEKLSKTEAKVLNVQESIRKLKSLKDCASHLSASNLMLMRNILGDEIVDDLLYWLESPLQQIEAYLEELELLEDEEVFSSSLEDRYRRTGDSIVRKMKEQVQTIKKTCRLLVDEMDFSFLYMEKRGLFSIGYNVDRAQLDKSSYDLLASEARIASLIAIAKGDVPSEHWFRLGRRLTSLNRNEFLLSWGGTAFEYLMPLLFMRAYPHTLLSHTYKYIVEWQRSYANRFKRPWGFSESAYNVLNMDLNYQYRAFGAPGLGLKRGLAEEFVVAPYATLLSLMVNPVLSFENMKELNKLGAFGLWGYYDAIDFTREHLSEEESYKVVKIYMAHHHGMSMIALVNVLKDWPVHAYFHSDPKIRSCELLLQERIPRGIPIKEPHPIDVELEPGEQFSPKHVIENATENDLINAPPRIHLLSNGKLHAYEGHAGTGRLKYNNTILTGWKPDATEDPLGTFVYIKDLETGVFWSSHHQPVQRKPDRYDSWFHHSKIQTSRVDQWIETTTEITISPDHPIELRKITLTNYSDRPRKLELTSYGEIVLNTWEAYIAHPAFSKLFVQTDYLAENHSIIAWRRPRSSDEQPDFLVHTLAAHDLDHLTEPLQFETERAKFIGRGRSLKNPLAMEEGNRLSGSLGNVSDPVFSIRRVVHLGPGEKKEVTFGTGWARSREEAAKITDLFDNPYAVNRAFDLSVIYNNVELEHLGISSGQFHLFQKMAGYVIYNDGKLRAEPKIISQNRKFQSNLWGYGISGDLPLIVFRVSNTDQLKYVNRMLNGHLLWKNRGLYTDLLILNDHPPSYADEVEEGIKKAIEHHQSRQKNHDTGKVFLHRTERLPEEDLNLMLTYASVVLNGEFPNIDELSGRQRSEIMTSGHPVFSKVKDAEIRKVRDQEEAESLSFFNGYGGFTEQGKAYKLLINRDKNGELRLPPAPWINVISNPDFGFLATESGGGYTWSENSRENKLTSWANDPVLDPSSEAFYIRDFKSKRYWSLTPQPAPGAEGYEVTHGFGYSTYKHTSFGIRSELTQFVDLKDPVKISRIRVQNIGSTRKIISVVNYNEWVLGIQRDRSSRFVLQEFDDAQNALFAQNWYNNEFAPRTAFASVRTGEGLGAEFSFTTDRQWFIGRNNGLEAPEGISTHSVLNNEVVTGGDPCAAFQTNVWLEPGEEKEVVVILGEAESKAGAIHFIDKYSKTEETSSSFEKVTSYWDQTLSAIQVETPDDSLNTIMNGWLMYQTIACRMWARTGYYQAGGAFGFRDQLQDSMAALFADPELARKQILLHASRQFPEGDVLHWWHPPTARGIRSRITDDRLWLPYVTYHYIRITGKADILEEMVPFITARQLEQSEHEVYLQPHISSEKANLYEHCLRAVRVSLKFGPHGLPLMGGGDWNDGMNRVGHQGQGESVWLGFFLYQILTQFVDIAESRNDHETANEFKLQAEELYQKLNKEGWDGEWYLRAFYDDGTPLGSSKNAECRIDAISQSWAILSGVASRERAEKALISLEKYLISEQDGIIRLLDPPFDKTEKDPGYIKGYVPGVRENGGQYTHAAVWVIKAFAEQGHGEKAVRYLHMINPVNHGRDHDSISRYKTEPYAVAADVYGEPPFVGQGGWTWYTGSAGWMYQVILESVLGLKLVGDELWVKPSISASWSSYRVKWRLPDGKTTYEIEVENRDGVEGGFLEIEADGALYEGQKAQAKVKLKFDGGTHTIKMHLLKAESVEENKG